MLPVLGVGVAGVFRAGVAGIFPGGLDQILDMGRDAGFRPPHLHDELDDVGQLAPKRVALKRVLGRKIVFGGFLRGIFHDLRVYQDMSDNGSLPDIKQDRQARRF